MRINSDNGFTLMELMVALAVSALIAVGARNLIQTALIAERRVSALNDSAQLIRVLANRFDDDVEDAESIEGTATGVKLTTFEGADEREVEYQWDSETGLLTRTSRSVFASDGNADSSLEFTAEEFSLEYLTKDGDYEKDWSADDGLPLSLRLTYMEGGDSNGNRPVVLSAVPITPKP